MTIANPDARVNPEKVRVEIPHFIGLPDLAARLGVTRAHLARMVTEGTAPPSIRFGKLIKFDPVDVAAWLAARRSA